MKFLLHIRRNEFLQRISYLTYSLDYLVYWYDSTNNTTKNTVALGSQKLFKNRFKPSSEKSKLNKFIIGLFYFISIAI